MPKPYVICHMVMSLDGKVTGAFLADEACAPATEVYYDLNRRFASDGFLCGRVTMEESFTKGYYPDLNEYEPCEQTDDYIPETLGSFYAVALDPKGKLGWQSALIADDDPGYDRAQVIEVLTEQVDRRYLTYLRQQQIAYIFAGETDIDPDTVLFKLAERFGVKTLLLEGGSVTNGTFYAVDLIDEISVVIAPMVADSTDKPLFADSVCDALTLADSRVYDGGVVWLQYVKEEKNV